MATHREGRRLVATITPTDIHPGTRHFRSGDLEAPREELPWPAVVIVEETAEGFFLDRFTKGGEAGGDTWHMTMDDALEQARREYGAALGEWRAIPPDLEEKSEIVQYALESTKG